MIRPLRKVHRFIWLVFTPALLLLVLLMSDPGRDLHPLNDVPPYLSAKGAIP